MGHLYNPEEQRSPVDSRQAPRKRRRVVISCTECHRRKQKCDRRLPCANCVTRGKEHNCIYEDGAPTAKASRRSPPALASIERNGNQGPRVPSPTTAAAGASLASMAAQLGYGHSGSSTMGLLKSIETAPKESPAGGPTHDRMPSAFDAHTAAVRDKYKSLVRQLPSKMYIDKLVRIYFAEINDMYNFVDEAPFYQQLAEWNRMPFSTLSSATGGPGALTADMKVFPAILFQMLACAVLVLPKEGDVVFDALKYAGEMTFEDLAKDYSESGVAVAALFGKSNVCVNTVQAGFLRSLFLKYIANVTECWHTVSIAIRDAQEIGMHRDSLDPKPKDDSLESLVENQWYIQRRRKMYMILVTWDINMAVFLGRPDGGSWTSTLPSLPIDTADPQDSRYTPIVVRSEDSPPSLYTKNLWLFRLARPIKEIHDLEKEGVRPREFSKVDEVHRMIMDLEEQKPAPFRMKNPDTRWDNDPNLQWLRSTRPYFMQMHYFSLMALHRPYVFHRKESRAAALQASLEMLEVQRSTFKYLAPSSWRNFNLFFGSFDALVVIASIYIIFPQEHPELRDNAVQHFHWTMERYNTMKDRNAMANQAQNVLAAIQARFVYAMGTHTPSLASPATSSTREPSLMSALSHPTPDSSVSVSSSTNGNHGATASAALRGSYIPEATPTTAQQWDTWASNNLASMAPTYPTTDLLYNDLMVMKDTQFSDAPQDNLQFGGDFEENTFWQFLNQLPSGTGDIGNAGPFMS